MKQLLIIGARGFGREVYNLALDAVGYGIDFTVRGFLDDNAEALKKFEGYPPIISSVENYAVSDEDVFVCALGNVNDKKKYAELIQKKGGHFINLIHKDVYISQNVKIGEGCIFCRGVHISCDIRIGNFVTVQPYAVLGHDVEIDHFCHLNTYSFLGGGVRIEELATLHTAAIIQPHKRVGKSAVVGAGAFVIRNVKEGTTVYGNPAIKLKY